MGHPSTVALRMSDFSSSSRAKYSITAVILSPGAMMSARFLNVYKKCCRHQTVTNMESKKTLEKCILVNDLLTTQNKRNGLMDPLHDYWYLRLWFRLDLWFLY